MIRDQCKQDVRNVFNVLGCLKSNDCVIIYQNNITSPNLNKIIIASLSKFAFATRPNFEIHFEHNTLV